MAFDLSGLKRDESLRILSDAKLPNLMPLYHRYEQAQAMQLGRDIERSILTRPVTLYDQFGRPVQAPLTAKEWERSSARQSLTWNETGDLFCGRGKFQEGRLPEGTTLTTFPPFPDEP